MSLFKNSKSLVDSVTGLNQDRVHERTQGCWNCIHGRSDVARTYWLAKREKDLQIGIQLALESAMGEREPKVVNIRRMVALIDEGVRSGGLIKCIGPGVDANDNPVGDLVKNSYLCRNWSGAQGASVAREGQAPDLLPMELEDRTK